MWETIQSGGPMMLPLILSAALAIAYSIERALVLNRMPTADEAKQAMWKSVAQLGPFPVEFLLGTAVGLDAERS